jgi:ABC-type sugar transport system substrate-binding protein
MSRTRKHFWWLIALVVIVAPMTVPVFAQDDPTNLYADAIAACPADQSITIMSSLPDLAFPFFVHMQNQIAAEAESIGNIQLIQLDGENDATKQTADVENAIVQGVDAIVISPIQVDAISPALQQAIDAGIPVITIDRRVVGVDGILAHVGADNVAGGEVQANTAVAVFPDGAAIFHLQGQPGAGPAIDRNQGVHNILDTMADKYPFVFEQTANFRRDEGLSVTEAGLAGLSTPPNVIIAANDDMALGALEAVIAAGLQDEIQIYGFDALPEALASVRDGGLTGTIEQFPGGQSRIAMRIAALVARNCAYEANPLVLLTPIMITQANLDQSERIGELGMEATPAAAPGTDLYADSIAACPADQSITIMSSLPDLAFPFFVHMQAQIAAEAESIGNIELIQLDGENDATKQTADVENAIVQGVDAIVISPIQVDAISPALQQAIDAGIPVITIDRRVVGVDGILAHVGADNVAGGEVQANTAVASFPDGASIFHLQGQPGAGPAIDRNQGVHNILDGMSAFPFVFEQTANFRRDEGLSVTEAGLAGLSTPPNVIIAANDDMALGALEAVIAAGLQDEIQIYGFDALPEALASVRDGGLTGTIEQFPGGQSRIAMRIAALNARGCGYEANPLVLLTPIMITQANLDQAERIGELQ